MSVIKCKDFEVACGNSDAKCFVDCDSDNEHDYEFLAKCRLVEDNSLCSLCPYNEDYEHLDYNYWNDFNLIVMLNSN